MQIRFKCPECENSLLSFHEEEGLHVCESCKKEITTDEADKLFESGDIIATLVDGAEYLSEEECDEEDDMEDDEEDMDDEEEADNEVDVEESFYGFSNRDTWAANLILQNEYQAFKDVSRVLEDPDKVRKVAEKHIKEANVDSDKVDWNEVTESLKDAQAELTHIKEDLISALNENEVDEAVRDNLVTVFEAALMVQYNNLKNSVEEKFETELNEAIEKKENELVEQMSGYADEAVNEWFDENRIALESGIRTEITESFMNGLTTLLKEHFIEVPEDRYDLIEDMADKIEYLEGLMEAKNDEVNALTSKLNEHAKDRVIAKLSEGLADTQVEKLIELSGSIDYESEEQFEQKLSSLKESFLKVTRKRKEGDAVVINEQVITETDDDEKSVDFNDPIARAAYGLRKKN